VLKPEPPFEALESLLVTASGRGAENRAATQKRRSSAVAGGNCRSGGPRGDSLHAAGANHFIRTVMKAFLMSRVVEHLSTEEMSIGGRRSEWWRTTCDVVIDARWPRDSRRVGNDASHRRNRQRDGKTRRGGHPSSAAKPRVTRFVSRINRGRGVVIVAGAAGRVLDGGNHATVAKWRKAAATGETRPQSSRLAGRNKMTLPRFSLILCVGGPPHSQDRLCFLRRGHEGKYRMEA